MATQDPTTNYSWDLPTVGGSSGAWGTALNTIIGDDVTGIDKVVYDISVIANAALPKAGGVMTGEIDTLTQIYTSSDLGNMSGTSTLDFNAANAFYGTVTGAVSIAFSNVPSSGKFVFGLLEITNGGSNVSWPGYVKWPGGSTPILTTSGVDLITLYTRDGGTTWRATLAQENSA